MLSERFGAGPLNVDDDTEAATFAPPFSEIMATAVAITDDPMARPIWAHCASTLQRFLWEDATAFEKEHELGDSIDKAA